MKLTLFFAFLLLAISLGGCRGKSSTLSLGQTNILLIMIDTLRADHLGCYGYEKNTSPSIDGIARKGVRVRQCISSSPWTRPSVASIVTSTYPPTHGIVKEMFDVLPSSLLTLAEFLRESGYHTFGYTANPNLNAVFGFDQGFENYVESHAVFDWMHRLEAVPDEAPTGIERFLSARTLTDIVLEDLQRISPPFYLQVFYIDPHFPYDPPPEYLMKFGGENARDRYDGEIALTDMHVGRLMDTIWNSFPNTLVVVTSDHGEGFNENNDSILNERHGNFLYQTTVQVPLIISHPSLTRREIDGVFELIDLFPTIVELLGLDPPADLQGTSHARAILAGESTGKQFAYMETGWRNMRKTGIISDRWKYIVNADRELMNEMQAAQGREPYFLSDELYDLSAGLPERTRENQSRTRSELLDSMRTRLAEFRRHLPQRGERGKGELDRHTREQLEALGYLGGRER